MRFYGQDDDDHEDEMEEFFDEEDGGIEGEDFEDILSEDFRELKIAELNLIDFDLKQRLLKDTVSMLEKTFLWKFLPHKTKLERIAETYAVLEKLVSRE